MIGRMVGRFVAVAAAVMLALAFAAGCGATEAGAPSRFVCGDEACAASVIVDAETGVQYLCVRVYGNGVSVTPLLDEWGFPLLAEGHQRGARVEPSMDVDERGADDE